MGNLYKKERKLDEKKEVPKDRNKNEKDKNNQWKTKEEDRGCSDETKRLYTERNSRRTFVGMTQKSVSYTHLTLPTIYSV